MSAARLAPAVLFSLSLATSSAAQVTGIVRGPDAACTAPIGPLDGELFGGSYGPTAHVEAAFIDGMDRLADSALPDWHQRTGALQFDAFGTAIFALVTHWPPGAVTRHDGHLGFVVEDDPAFMLGTFRVEALPRPRVQSRPGLNVVTWPPWPAGGTTACAPGGGPAACGPSAPPGSTILGWNVYRLDRALVPPATSTPSHYLLGPDLDGATTADNGFVGFVPADAAPDAQGRLRFEDDDLRARGASWIYVVQPVLDARRIMDWTVVFADVDADGILDVDIDADGVPEFVSPDANGLGLTGRLTLPVGFRKDILISRDSAALDPLLFVRKLVGGGLEVAWTLDAADASDTLDLYGDGLADVSNLGPTEPRDTLACDLPAAAGTVPLVDVAGDRYYLLATDAGGYDWSGATSRGQPRPVSVPGCP